MHAGIGAVNFLPAVTTTKVRKPAVHTTARCQSQLRQACGPHKSCVGQKGALLESSAAPLDPDMWTNFEPAVVAPATAACLLSQLQVPISWVLTEPAFEQKMRPGHRSAAVTARKPEERGACKTPGSISKLARSWSCAVPPCGKSCSGASTYWRCHVFRCLTRHTTSRLSAALSRLW